MPRYLGESGFRCLVAEKGLLHLQCTMPCKKTQELDAGQMGSGVSSDMGTSPRPHCDSVGLTAWK